MQKPRAYAWLIFGLSASFLFYKYILQISPAVLTHELMQTYDLTGTSLGFLVGFYFYTYMIMQIPSGILLDRYGPRKITGLAIFICAFGIILFSQTQIFWVACFARLLIGFGAAFATTSYMKLASMWFPTRYFPLLSGLFGTACMAGAGTAQAPLSWLIGRMDWHTVLALFGMIGIILAILFWSLVKERDKAPAVRPFHFKDLIKIFKKKENWPLILFGGLSFTPIAVFGGLWGVPYLMAAYPIEKTAAASAISLIFLGFAVGGVVTGFIGKHVKRQLPVMAIGTFLALIFLSIVIYVPHLSLFWLSTCIFLIGFSGSSFLLTFAIANTINASTLIATVIGVINMGDPLCGAIADPLIGKVLDLNWNGQTLGQTRLFSVQAYHWGLSVLVFYLVLALLCCCFIREDV